MVSSICGRARRSAALWTQLPYGYGFRFPAGKTCRRQVAAVDQRTVGTTVRRTIDVRRRRLLANPFVCHTLYVALLSTSIRSA